MVRHDKRTLSSGSASSSLGRPSLGQNRVAGYVGLHDTLVLREVSGTAVVATVGELENEAGGEEPSGLLTTWAGLRAYLNSECLSSRIF